MGKAGTKVHSEEINSLLNAFDDNKILIVMEQGIGNMIMLTPTLRAIKQAKPTLKAHIMGTYPALEVIEGWDCVDKIIPAPEYLEDYTIVFYTMWSQQTRQALDNVLSKASMRQFQLIYNDPNQHEAINHFQIARLLGYEGEVPQPYCSTEAVDIKLPDKEIIGLCDTTLQLDAWQRKRWPHYNQLAFKLHDMGYKIALFGSMKDAKNYDQLTWPTGTWHLYDKGYSVTKSAYLMTKCKAIVANDSGTAHMAAAVGAPTYVLFGPTLPSKNIPTGKTCKGIITQIDCSPCQYTPRWDQCNDFKCLSAISPDDVIDRLELGTKETPWHNDGPSPHRRAEPPIKNKKILLVGVLDVPSSTNVFMKKGFEKLGYTVDAYNYRTVTNQLGTMEAMWQDFNQFISDGRQYELIIFCKVNSMHPDCILEAKKAGKTWYWFMDNIHVAHAIHANKYVKRADFASSTSSEVVEWFKLHNKNSYWVTEGFDPDIYFPEELEKKYETVFIGNATPERVEWIRDIRRETEVEVFGNGWPSKFNARSPVYNDDFRKVVNSSKIILNFVHSNIFSDRVVMSMACGGFVLSEFCKDFKMLDHSVLTFKTPKEAIDLIKIYLSQNMNSTVATEIKDSVHYVHKYFKWQDVCQTVLNIKKVVENTKRILFVSWHGLGDNVMLTAALRQYKIKNPTHHIAVAGLKRFGQTLNDLLSGLPFIDEVLPILPDAWNDFIDYQNGTIEVEKMAKQYGKDNNFDQVVILPTNRRNDGYELHKLFRFAHEVGIKYDNLDELQTALSTNVEGMIKAEKFLENIPRPWLVLHTVAGNSPKTLDPSVVKELLEGYRGYSVLEFGRQSHPRSILVPEDDMEFSKALISMADQVVAIDSVVMHIAGALLKPLKAVFTMTPVHQALPVTYPVEVVGFDNEQTRLNQWSTYKREIYSLFANDKKKEIIDSLKGNYHPVPFEGYPTNAVRDAGCYKRWKAINNILPKNQIRILDIGCNIGFFCFEAAKLRHEVIGIDNDIDCISTAISIAHHEQIKNVTFAHTTTEPLSWLSTFEDNQFDFVFYLSVHHHMYEQYTSEEVIRILKEISRISKNMIFDMGQPNEQGSEWTPWIKLIPQWQHPKTDIIQHVLNNSNFVYAQVITSTEIHGAERWCYWFSKEMPETPSEFKFDGKVYDVQDCIIRTIGGNGRLLFYDDFPEFEPIAETKVRYYRVTDIYDEEYFVKEILYNPWLNVTPEQAARNEFDRGQLLADNPKTKRHVLPAIGIDKNFLLFEYCDWPNLIHYKGDAVPQDVKEKIIFIAEEIKATGVLKDFDLNLNNILYKNERNFKFIDFGYAECEWEWRKAAILKGT